MAYFGYVTTLENVLKDPKSDNLYTATCMSEGVIVGGESQNGDKVLYLPADGQVARWFGDEFQLFRKNLDGTSQGGYLDEKGHIKALKLRGLRSEGIAIPWAKVVDKHPTLNIYEVGDKFNEINGEEAFKKYIPRQRQRHAPNGAPKASYRGRKAGRKAGGVIYPEFARHSDTAQLAYNRQAFREGDEISISLKMHGTSQRSMNTIAEYPRNWFRKLFRMKPRQKPVYILGTRRCVVTENSTGYYGNDTFRMPHHKKIERYVSPGMEVFYEVVGYYNEDGTIMPSANNKKLNDKKFVKQFGPTTDFTYGCAPGQSEMYVYRITTHNGELEYSPEGIKTWCEIAGVPHVPFLERFIFTTWEDLLDRVNAHFEDLTDPIGKTHLKEGVVVRILNRKNFSAFKSKTYEFKVLEGIIKETATEADMEESEELDDE